MHEIHETFGASELPAGFTWFNEPADFRLGGGLEMVTRPKSDFWQRTHCGERRDNGHCLLTTGEGNFAAMTCVEAEFVSRYDQCGLMLRVDAENWIKVSTEREDDRISRLGAVVTNLGYSDWSSQDISSQIQKFWYRVHRSGDDFLVQSSLDGSQWRQMREAHLHRCPDVLEVGVYACSPTGDGFACRFCELAIGESDWA